MNIELLKGKTFLITGASGFIGSSLVNKLLSYESQVIAITHRKDLTNDSVERIRYDGTYESIFNPLRNLKIDGVLHLATMFLSNHRENQIGELIDSNIKFGTYLLEIAKKKKFPFFINTTTYAQSFNHNGYNTQKLYAATKQSFEDIIKYYEVDSEIFFMTLELTDTYGKNDTRPKFINQLLNAIENNVEFKMSKGEQEINYLNIEDASNAFIIAIMLIIEQNIKKGAHFSVYSNETYKLIDLVQSVKAKFNSDIPINNGYYPYRNREIMTFQPSYSKLPEWNANVSLMDGISTLLNK